jgi:hypothetical protein
MLGDKRLDDPIVRRKNKRRKKPADRLAALRYEQLEERLTLTSNPTLSIPTTLVGARGGVVAVPIDVNQLTNNPGGFFATTAGSGSATQPLGQITIPTIANLQYVNATRIGLSSADFAIDFDPNVFTVSASDVHLGTIPVNVVAFNPPSLQPNTNPTPAGWIITTSMSPAYPGQLKIHLASNSQFANIVSGEATSAPEALSSFGATIGPTTGRNAGSIESLVMIDFHIKPNAPIGRSQINLAANNAVGIRPTQMFDATGRLYALAPAPTNGAADIGVDGTLNVLPTAPAIGTWTAVTLSPFFPPPPPPANLGPVGLGTMILLPDGSVMANAGQDQATPFWFKLTPDATGNYANGTWTQLASMDLGRLFFGSTVLKDGRVMVLGGEYTGPPTVQTEDPTGAIYDPATNTWTPITSFPQPLFNPNIQSQNPPPAQEFGDGQLELMNDGSVLAGFLGFVYGTTKSPTFRYYPDQDLWVQDATLLNGDSSSEEAWVKLADGSILTYQLSGTNPGSAERLILGDLPADDQWVPAGHVPVNLGTNIIELGPGTLLPDGRVFQIGGTSNTAIYTPPTPGNPTGSWAAGPLIPGGLGANDAPAAVLPNGRVLFTASSTPNFVGAGTSLFEYDPITNTINAVNNLPAALKTNLSFQAAFNSRMLVLPSGQVLFNDSSNQAYVYTPAGGLQDSWRPTISDVELTGTDAIGNNVYTLTGTQLNGLSEGAYYGDDAQQATNFPVIQLVNQAGNVVFATTFNWSSAWVATGSAIESVDFTLPAGTTLSDYASFRVIASGVSSFPTNQTIPLGTANVESVIIRVDPGNPGLVDIVNAATNLIISTHPNNANWGTINIVGDATNNSVTIDNSNGIVNAPVNFNGGGAGSPANDQLVVLGAVATMSATGNDNLVITPTSAISGAVTDNGSSPYSYENISKVLFDGQTGTNKVAVVDTIGGGSLNINGAIVDEGGGTPFLLSNTQALSVNDNSAVGGDTINVLGTSIATTVGSTNGAGGDTINVTSDAPTNLFGNLAAIASALTVATGAGNNTLVVSDSGSAAANLIFTLTNKQITATDMPVPIGYTKGTGPINVVLDGSNLVATTFTVSSTLPATSTVTLNGGAINGNAFNIGSTALSNNGKLNSIGAAITVNGGGGTGNSLEINDHGTVGAFNYNITDSTVSYDFPTSPAGATFGGVTYSDIDTLQLDATEQPNKIVVSPSFTTVDTINGYGQLGGADSLGINTTNVTGSFTNNKMAKPGSPGSFNGNITFTDGHQTVNYTDIEQFPPVVNNPAILVYGADSGPTSQPLVKVLDARTGQLLNPAQPQGFLAYEPTFHGGVRVAVGYFDTTGQQEVAVAPGSGHTPIIKIFDTSGNLLYQFQAYATSMTNGVNIAAGNVEAMSSGGQEIDDLVTSPSRGVSDIRVFHNQVLANPAVPFTGTPFREFTAWGNTFAGGSSVAVADLNADGRGDIVLGSGPGMQPLIEAFDVTIPRASYSPFKIFYPFVATFHGGVNVSAINPGNNSDITAPTIVASQAAGGSGQVVVLNGNTGGIKYSTTVPNGSTGVRTAAKIIDGRFYVFAAQPTNGVFSKTLKIDPLAPSVVDFLIDTDPLFGRFFLG